MQPFVVSLSPNGSTKRLVAVFEDGTRARFGQPNATTFVDGATVKTKSAYLARHGSPNSREDWGASGRQTAGYLSRWVLWGPTRDIAANVRRIGGTFE